MRLRNIPISARLSYSFFLLSIVPILIVGVFASQTANQAIVSKSSNYSTQIMKTLKSNIENELNKYEKLADELILNANIQKGIETFDKMTGAQMYQFKENINDTIKRKFATYPYIRDVKIINEKNVQIYQRGYLLTDEKYLDTIIEKITQSGEVVNCFGTEIYNEKYIVLSKVIYSIYTKQKVGQLIFILDEAALLDNYRNIDLGKDSNIFLTDLKGEIISSKKKIDHLKGEFLILSKDAVETKEPVFRLEDGKSKQLLVHTSLIPYKLELFGTIPYEYLNQEAVSIWVNVVAVMFICFLLSILLSKIIANSITEPLQALVNHVSEAVEQKFDTDFMDDSKDELGFVNRTFRIITKKMKDMITQIEEEQKEKTALEISMLQAQINPHFLFNTLNSLRWISMMSGANSVSEGILALSELLKNTIIDKAAYISIQEEMSNVTNYLLIQKLRYGDFFEVEMDIPDHLKEYKTLKFILQPIVENAILHGGCDEQQTVTIHITLIEEEKGLVFVVKDDGKGFDVKEVESSKVVDKMSGIGVTNVQDRIQLNFGREYGLEIHSQVGIGTEVTLRIPRIGGDCDV